MLSGHNPDEDMDVQDGCDLTKLITDKFTINSAGKSPQTRKRESFARNFSSKMLPTTLSFDEVDTSCELPSWHNENAPKFLSENKSPFKMEEESNFDLNSVILNSTDNFFGKNKLEDSYDLNVIDKFNKTPKKCNTFLTRCNSSPLQSIENTLCNSPLLLKDSFAWRSKSDLEYSNKNNDSLSKINNGKENSMHCLKKKEAFKLTKSKIDTESGKTPSKFSVVQNSLRFSSKSPVHMTETLLQQDFTSRDSGFENSPVFVENNVKVETVPDYCNDFNKMSTRYQGYQMHEHMTSFETHGEFCGPSTSTSHSPPDPFSAIDALQDLEVEFDSAYQSNEPSCSKYEIISTDSPDICNVTGKVSNIIPRNFLFGSPIGDSETSESFNITPKVQRKLPPRSETTRMLNFDTEATATSFEFIAPKTPLPPKKLDSQSPTRVDIQKSPYNSFFGTHSKTSPVGIRKIGEKSPHISKDNLSTSENIFCQAKKMRVDSGLGDSTSPFNSPIRHFDDDVASDGKANIFSRKSSSRGSIKNSRPSRLFNCFSSGSVESGCVTETDDYMFDIDENCQENDCDMSTFPSSMHSLISGEIINKVKKSPKNAEEEKDNCVVRPNLRRCFSLQAEEGVEKARAALFRSPGKIRKRTDAGSEAAIVPKRRRSQVLRSIVEVPAVRPLLQRTISDNEATLKMALSQAYSEPNLIGDFSRPFSLPLDASKHQDLKAISIDTLAALIEGEFNDVINSFQVVDCRYPYEFEGGHIVGAQNLYTEEHVYEKLLAPFSSKNAKPSTSKNIIIFHCEFSLQRGPMLCRYLRRADRAMNQNSYPQLCHPELYILRGGYQQFHSQFAHHCRPVAGGYIPMSDPRFALDLRQHRTSVSRRAFQ